MKTYLLDTTLRDGSFIVNFQFTLEKTRALSKNLSRCGIDYLEVAHGGGVGTGSFSGLESLHTDLEYLRAAKESVLGATEVGVIAVAPRTTCAHLEPMWEYLDFLRVGVTLDHPDISLDLAAEVKRRGKKLFIQLMRSSSVSIDRLQVLAKQFSQFSPEALYIVDTTGSYQPTELRNVVKSLKQSVNTPLGFHGHDHLGLAFANSVIAVESGVAFVDGCLAGMGKGPGNAKTEELALWLNENSGGLYNVDQLKTSAEKHVFPLLAHADGRAKEVYDLSARFRLDLPLDLIAAIEQATHSSALEIFTTFKNLPNFFNIDEPSITKVVHQLLSQRAR